MYLKYPINCQLEACEKLIMQEITLLNDSAVAWPQETRLILMSSSQTGVDMAEEILIGGKVPAYAVV